MWRGIIRGCRRVLDDQVAWRRQGKWMMGHSFGKDITNEVYGHRTLEELRTEIEKIKV